MNCDNAQRWILLRETGELSHAELENLEKHMATCSDCRACTASTSRILVDARAGLKADGPDEAVIKAILAEAALNAGKPGRMVIFRRKVAILAACAAGFAVAVGCWVLLGSDENDRAMQIGRARTLAAILSSESYEFVDNSGTSMSHEQELRELARQLLIVEGFSSEQFESSLFQDGSAIPTDPRTSSMTGLLEERCV